MAKKTNYGIEKRRRENERKSKQEQKLLRKREAAAQKPAETPPVQPDRAQGEPE